MEKPIVSVPCVHHPSQIVHRIDPDLAARKNLYCYECMLQTENGSNLYKTLPSINNFLDIVAGAIARDKNYIKPTSNPPAKFAESFSKQTEILDRLRVHLKTEKKKIESRFEEISQALLEVVNQTKNEYLRMIDEQEVNLFNNYASFVKELESGYPKPEDIDMWFPTRAELERKLNKARTSYDLEEVVKDFKQNLLDNRLGIIINRQPEQARVAYFDELLKNLKRVETITPTFIDRGFEFSRLKEHMKRELGKYLERNFILKDAILTSISDYQSTIIKEPELVELKEMLPKQLAAGNLKLLYRGSRDGMAPEVFHARCDNKGPTVTLVKARFNDSANVSIFGGFLDKDWHNKNATIPSTESFLFSLTTHVKCPISKNQNAGNGYAEFGPSFGGGNDFRIARDLTQCYVNPNSYVNCEQIVESDSYPGSGHIYFTPIDVEVYAVRP